MTYTPHHPVRSTNKPAKPGTARKSGSLRPEGKLPTGLRLQAKFRIGASNDPLEHEADRVAAIVVSGTHNTQSPPSDMDGPAQARQTSKDAVPDFASIRLPSFVQRKCNACSQDDDDARTIRRKTAAAVPAACSCSAGCAPAETEAIQEKAETPPSAQREPADSFARALVTERRIGGAPLPTTLRSFMEPRFGADFSAIRVHAGQRAARLTRDINARAFTIGSDIFFARGAYDPATSTGKRLIAHELTHTLQQGQGEIRRVPEGPPGNEGTPAPTEETSSLKTWFLAKDPLLRTIAANKAVLKIDNAPEYPTMLVQYALKKAGFPAASYGPFADGVDGLFKSKTKGAVEAFQTKQPDFGFKDRDGVVGRKTLLRLDDIVSTLPSPPPIDARPRLDIVLSLETEPLDRSKPFDALLPVGTGLNMYENHGLKGITWYDGEPQPNGSRLRWPMDITVDLAVAAARLIASELDPGSCPSVILEKRLDDIVQQIMTNLHSRKIDLAKALAAGIPSPISVSSPADAAAAENQVSLAVDGSLKLVWTNLRLQSSTVFLQEFDDPTKTCLMLQTAGCAPHSVPYRDPWKKKRPHGWECARPDGMCIKDRAACEAFEVENQGKFGGDCPFPLQVEILRALAIARTLAKYAAGAAQPDADFECWFGDKKHFKRVQARLQKISNRLSTDVITWRCRDSTEDPECEDHVAHTLATRHAAIHICFPTTGKPTELALTLVHEVAHNVFAAVDTLRLNQKDTAETSATRRAKNAPLLATSTAENYELYVKSLATNFKTKLC